MKITRLEKIEKEKFKVYVNHAYVFQLNQKEITNYQLEEGNEINVETYNKIWEDILYRGKQKALSILKFMDRTEQELRNKLYDAGYLNDIIEKTIDYVKEYGYLDDERYAASYIRGRKFQKSKKALQIELMQKGIGKEMIDRAFLIAYGEEECEDPEIIAIRKAIDKRMLNPEELTWEKKQKLMAALYRKGFAVDKIRQVLE